MTRRLHPGSRHLVLLGGGHTHSLVLLALAREPLADTRITLVSDTSMAAYSGMLPGHIAGIYRREEIHIDLAALCRDAGANLIVTAADGIAPETRTVLNQRTAITDPADILSINVGAIPDSTGVPGAAEYGIPSKPVPALLAGWDRLCIAAASTSIPPRVVIVGGGAGGVELALAMQARLGSSAHFTLVHHGDEPLARHPPQARRTIAALLDERGINRRPRSSVTAVEADAITIDHTQRLSADFTFWITQPSPQKWLRNTSLALDPAGFIRVRPTLQCINHSAIFAAGDVASIEHTPLPKAGVFAVRMADPLVANLRALHAGRALRSYQPQTRFLSLISTADGRALATRGTWVHRSRLMAWWKDRIDRRFMRRFEIN